MRCRYLSVLLCLTCACARSGLSAPVPAAVSADEYAVWATAIAEVTRVGEESRPVAVLPWAVRRGPASYEQDDLARSPLAASIPAGMIAAFASGEADTAAIDLPKLARLAIHAL